MQQQLLILCEELNIRTQSPVDLKKSPGFRVSMRRRNQMPKLRKKITRDFTTIHNTMLRDMRLGMTEHRLPLTIPTPIPKTAD